MAIFVQFIDLADSDGVDKTSNEAIAAEFFEEYVCDEDEDSASQGNFCAIKSVAFLAACICFRYRINSDLHLRFKQSGFGQKEWSKPTSTTTFARRCRDILHSEEASDKCTSKNGQIQKEDQCSI